MAHIENRSRTQVTVKNRSDLTRLFPHNKLEAAQRYISELRSAGFKPVAAVLDEAYLVRYRLHGKRCNFTARTEKEALATLQRIESEQHHGLFVDYTQAHRLTMADLLVRYLKEEAPRQKGYLITAYQINMWLEDAGLPRQDIAAIHAAHPAPYNRQLKIPSATGRRMSQPSDATQFITRPFASLQPADFQDYIDERLQVVSAATVDRELDVFRAVCQTAMAKWRIHVHISPMAGLERPKYFNERDRRLREDEESRLMAAARVEDQRWATRLLADELYANKRTQTKYQRLKSWRESKSLVVQSDLRSQQTPMLSTFIQFQLMTGARRSETLKLKWEQVDLDRQTAFLPETKNGRSRTLPLRSDLVTLLKQLPRTDGHVFPISVDYLRKAWIRMCEAAGIPTDGDDRLRIHDLRHEAISRIAEAACNTPGGFSLLDLQAFSGHRDPRMLMRYAHLTPTGLAKRLDAAFATEGHATVHHGRRRITQQAGLSVSELLTTPLESDIALPPQTQSPSNVVNFMAYRSRSA